MANPVMRAEPGAQGYAVVQNAGGLSGGVGGCCIDGYPGHLTFYVAVDDLDATLRKAESLGATTLTGPTPLPNDRGHFAHIQDPQGHMVGLIQPARAA
jgi:predicted enzyme related to lactoylglutathione lyase